MRESRFIAAIRRSFTGLSDFSREKRLHAIDSGELEEIVYDARQAVKGEFDVVFTTWVQSAGSPTSSAGPRRSLRCLRPTAPSISPMPIRQCWSSKNVRAG